MWDSQGRWPESKTWGWPGGKQIDETQIPHWCSVEISQNVHSEWNWVSKAFPLFRKSWKNDTVMVRCSSALTVRTWEEEPWAGLSPTLICTARSYCSQEKCKLIPIRGKNPEVSIKCPLSFQLLSRLSCTELSVYLPLEHLVPEYVITYYFFGPGWRQRVGVFALVALG